MLMNDGGKYLDMKKLRVFGAITIWRIVVEEDLDRYSYLHDRRNRD